MKMNRGGPPLGQRERTLFRRLGEPLQVHPRGPQISTADYVARLFKIASTLFSPARFHNVIEPHSGKGNKKIREKPLRVLQAERFRPTTAGHGNLDPHIFQAVPIAVAAWHIPVNLKRMHFSA
ncbi:MAG: hypothetical protein ACLFNT_05150 [Spirochaetales bacterium]